MSSASESESLSDQDTSSATSRLLSNMEARAEHLKSRNYRALYSFTTAVGVGAVVMVVTWVLRYRGGLSWSSDPKTEFNWHPVLMVLGMVFLYGHSALIYRTGRSCVKKRLKLAHALVNFLAFVLSVIGLKAAFDSHNLAQPPKPNLYSLHSWFGLVTVIVFAGQFLLGFLAFLYPGLSKSIRQSFLPVHTATGIGLFCLALLAALTGLTEKTIWTLGDKYSGLPAEGILLNFLGIFLGIFGILVLYLVNDGDYKRTAMPEDELVLAGSDD